MVTTGTPYICQWMVSLLHSWGHDAHEVWALMSSYSILVTIQHHTNILFALPLCALPCVAH